VAKQISDRFVASHWNIQIQECASPFLLGSWRKALFVEDMAHASHVACETRFHSIRELNGYRSRALQSCVEAAAPPVLDIPSK
jgi:hypothetical protein